MSAPRLRQPLGIAIRQNHACPKLATRCYATAFDKDSKDDAWEVDVYGYGRKKGDPNPTYRQPPKRKVPDYSFFPQPTTKKPEPHKSFAIYAPPPRSKFLIGPKNPMQTLARREIARLDPTGVRAALFRRDAKDAVKPGDVLRVTSTKGEPFAGVLINLRRRGADTAILLRGQMAKIGVEMWYKVFSSKVVRIDVILRRPKRARRVRLTYMRKPKHDMGSVDHLVDAWFRSRVTIGKAKARPKKGETKVKVMKRHKVRAKEAKKLEGQKRREDAIERLRIKKEKEESEKAATTATTAAGGENKATSNEKKPEEEKPDKTKA